MTESEFNCFIRFLKENGIYNSYKVNLNRQNSEYHLPLKDSVRNLGTYDIINESFVWRKTPEGHSFWNTLNVYFNIWRRDIFKSDPTAYNSITVKTALKKLALKKSAKYGY